MAQFLALLVCFLGYVCLGAHGETEALVVEPPFEFQEAASEGEREVDAAAQLRLAGGKSDVPFTATLTGADAAAANDSTSEDAAAAPAAVLHLPRPIFASPLLISIGLPPAGSQACLVQLLLDSVPTRGPTVLS